MPKPAARLFDGQELDAPWHGATAVYDSGDFATHAPVRDFANSVGQSGTDDPEADGLLSGTHWTGTVTYSFTDSASDYASGYGAGEHKAPGFAQISVVQQQAVHGIMDAIESFSQVNIEFAGTGNADIRIATSSAANPTAVAYYPSNSSDGEGGDVWFGTSYNFSNPLVGNYSYLIHLHELGHSFGLKHAHEEGGVAGPLPANHDGLEYSVMSYRSYVGGPTTGFTNESYGYPQSYMMNDILALQKMYGADFTLNAGDSEYSWSPNTGQMSIDGVAQNAPGANRVFLTIWDGGGEDTYNLSAYSGSVTINLEPGSFSNTSRIQTAYLGDGHYAQGNIYNAYQFNGDPRSLIENAIGGSGNDFITGNIAANDLDGGRGNDTLTGGAGDDLFIYRVGGGHDVITDFAAGADDIWLDGIAGVGSFDQAMAFAAQVGADTVFNFGTALTLKLLNVTLTALAAGDFAFSDPNVEINDAPTGIALDGNTLTENLAGGIVADVSVADPDSDAVFTFTVSDPRFEIVGSPGAYVLKLKADAAIDYETEQTIALSVTATDAGGLSHEQIFIIDVLDAAGSSIKGTVNADIIDIANIPAGQNALTHDGDTINSSKGNDLIQALSGNDLISGGGGSDQLNGGLGDDTLIGGGGADALDGGDGIDTASYAGSGSVVVNLASGLGRGGHAAGDTFAGIENLTGGKGNDSLTGDDNDNLLNGAGGRDTLAGGAGNDCLMGGGGKDTLTGGDGADSFIFVSGSGRDTVTDYTAGTDSFDFSAVAAVDSFDDLIFTQTTATDVTINWGVTGESVVVKNADVATLTANQSDFLFA